MAKTRILWFFLFVSSLYGCKTFLDGATLAANAAADLGDRTHDVLAEHYEAAQEEALASTDDPAVARERVLAVRAEYAPAWKAYRAFRAAWITLAAAIEAARNGAQVNVAQLLGRLAEAQKAFSEVLAK